MCDGADFGDLEVEITLSRSGVEWVNVSNFNEVWLKVFKTAVIENAMTLVHADLNYSTFYTKIPNTL